MLHILLHVTYYPKMVVVHNLQDVFIESSRQSTLNLPIIKQNYLNIDFENSDNKETVYNGTEPSFPFAASRVITAGISNWRRLTAHHDNCKGVYELTFDIKGSNLNFRPGDTIGVIPKNLDKEVNFVIDHLELSDIVDCTYNVTVNSGQKGVKIPAHVPVKSTLRYVLTHCVDLRGVVKKLFLLALSRYTKDDIEKKVLEYLCSKEGSTSYTNILNKSLCILDLFDIFKTCKPPIEVLLEHLPRLLPRPYSVLNSNLTNPNEIKICFSVINIGNRKGLVTGWLEKIINESLEDMMSNMSITDNKAMDKIPIYLRKNINEFSFSDDISKPMLLIGPGTGVAPYIAFLEERKKFMKEKKRDENMIWLFFGCRSPDLDFLYKHELQAFMDSGVLSKLTTTFSRLDNCETKYIQDAIISNGEEVAKLLKNGASVYVCGDVKTMATQVKDSFVHCLVNFAGITREDAVKFICDMQREKTYLIDTWN